MSEPLQPTDPEYSAEHTESTELRSPGNPLFVPTEHAMLVEAIPPETTLKDIPDGG